MPQDQPQLSAEELLRQFRWMKPLARSLVRDEAGAEDLVQESWLTFLKRPPQDPLARSSWMRKVLFNFALRRRRAERNRDRRERLAARPERQDTSPAQLLERAELHRKVVDLVLSLEEPHRSTILYRFFEDLTPAEIARRQGLPVTTVRSRIAKALERLRSRLDREQGGRTGWCIALAPLAGLEFASTGPLSAAPAGLNSAAPGLGAPAAPAAVLETWKTISSGGILVTTKKLTLALVVSALILLGLGGVFYSTDHWRARITHEEAKTARGETDADRGIAVESTPPPVADQPATPASAAKRPGDERPISIQGRVVGPGGRGIPEARVAALDSRVWRGILVGIEDRYSNPQTGVPGLRREFADLAARSPAVTTGADGSFVIRGLVPAEYSVVASHPEHLRSSEMQVLVPPAGGARCDLELAEGNLISGRLVDEEGRPVEGALISSENSLNATARGISKVIQSLDRFAEGEALVPVTETRSLRDGSFQLGSLEPVPQDLLARKPGRALGRARRVPPGTRGLTMVVPRGETLSGRLLDSAGNPVAGAVLELKDFQTTVGDKAGSMAADMDLSGERDHQTSSRGDGRFLFEGLEEGQYELAVRIGRPRVFSQVVEIEARAQDLGDLTLAEVFTVSGTVLGPAGEPVEGANLRATPLPDPYRAAVAEIRSGAGGRFAFEGLPAGSYRLAAWSADHAQIASGEVEQGGPEVVLRLADAVAFTGVCLAAAGRTPISGATVRLLPEGARDETGCPPVTTDEDGEFSFRCIASAQRPEGRRHRIIARHPEYEEGWVQVPREAAGPVEILLAPASGVRGVVVDPAGNPVAGARLRIEVPGVAQIVLAASSNFNEALGPRYSDAEGRFFLKVPRRGGLGQEVGIDVAAAHTLGRGRVSLFPVGREGVFPEVEVRLAPVLSLEGRVRDTGGTGVAGAQVRAVRQGSGLLPPPLNGMQALLVSAGGPAGYSERDGAFRIPSLEPGLYRLEVRALGCARKTIDSVAVGEEATRIDIVMEPGGSIRGRVIDHAGLPVGGAEVVALPEAEVQESDRDLVTRVGAGLALARSDGQGRFELTQLPEEVASVVARAKGFEPARSDGARAGEEVADLVLVAHGSVAGQVLDRDTGAPVGDFHVRLEQAGKGPQVRRRTLTDLELADDRGRFRFDDLPAGDYLAEIESAAYRRFSGSVRVEPGREAAFEARLEPGLRFGGIVRALDTRKALEGVALSLIPLAGEGEDAKPGARRDKGESAMSEEDGTFLFPGLAPGDYRLLVRHKAYYLDAPPEGLRVAVTGVTAPLELDLPPAGMIRGRLGKGKPPDPASVSYEVIAHWSPAGEERNVPGPGQPDPEPSDSISGRTRVQPDGQYVLGGLRPGRHRLEVIRHLEKETLPANPSQPAIFVEVGPGEVRTADLEGPGSP